MDSSDLLARLRTQRLVAIVRGRDPDAALAAVLTLAEEGIQLIEVSLNTADALAVIARAAQRLSPGTALGAGTVLTAADVREAAEAGARWMVTPAVAESVHVAADAGLPVLAGAFTPSEAVAAVRAGATAVKLFPASTGGPTYLRALRDPLPQVPFVPVGGVDAALAREYLSAGAVAVGVGSPLVVDAAHGDDDLDALRERARAFVSACRGAGAPDAEVRW